MKLQLKVSRAMWRVSLGVQWRILREAFGAIFQSFCINFLSIFSINLSLKPLQQLFDKKYTDLVYPFCEFCTKIRITCMSWSKIKWLHSKTIVNYLKTFRQVPDQNWPCIVDHIMNLSYSWKIPKIWIWTAISLAWNYESYVAY